VTQRPRLSRDIVRSGQDEVQASQLAAVLTRIAGLGPGANDLNKSRLGMSSPDRGRDAGVGVETVQYDVRVPEQRTVLMAEKAAFIGACGWSAAPGHLEARLAEPAEVGQGERGVVIFDQESGNVIRSGWRTPSGWNSLAHAGLLSTTG
jgi:hypothetical protein